MISRYYEPKKLRICAIALVLLLSLCMAHSAYAITAQELRAKIEAATKDFKEFTLTGNAVYKNKDVLAKIDASYARLYEFQSASVSWKEPDKLRMDGKLGMVKFEYIINGGTKIFRAPKLKISKKEDFTNEPAKTQDALDLGIVTTSLWRNRRVEVIDDSAAAAAGQVKVRLYWPKGDMIYLAWIDEQDLCLRQFEKRDPNNKLLVRAVYSNPKRIDGIICMPTTVDVYSADGEKAGTSQYVDIKVNSGLPDTLFQ